MHQINNIQFQPKPEFARHRNKNSAASKVFHKSKTIDTGRGVGSASQNQGHDPWGHTNKIGSNLRKCF